MKQPFFIDENEIPIAIKPLVLIHTKGFRVLINYVGKLHGRSGAAVLGFKILS
jgi:hypothetical protein